MKELRSHCPINYGLESFGDSWSLLIIRDMVFFNKRTYGEFLQSKEGIATNILASRLLKLEEKAIIRRSPHTSDKRRDVYDLTEKGLDLIPILIEISYWSSQYDAQTGATDSFIRAYKADKIALAEALKRHIREGKLIDNTMLDRII
jgi:DNA-binding HxlR family transcriptional regulator